MDLTLIGVGCTIGAGSLVLTGIAAANYAGPVAAFSFSLAVLASLCVALRYTELASVLPISGSAYTSASATFGELVVGWSFASEYLLFASTVAVGWAGYRGALLNELSIHLPPALNQSLYLARWRGAIGCCRQGSSMRSRSRFCSL